MTNETGIKPDFSSFPEAQFQILSTVQHLLFPATSASEAMRKAIRDVLSSTSPRIKKLAPEQQTESSYEASFLRSVPFTR
jgi:hypothetical protein